MRDYAELILDLRRHHCDAKEDDTQEVCEECAYDVIVADKSKFNGITDVCTCGLMHRAADAIEELLAAVPANRVDYKWLNASNSVIATMTIEKFECGWTALSNFEIAEAYRGQGLSHKLIEFAKTKGVNNLSVDPNNSIAINLYQQHGFFLTGETDGNLYRMRLTKPPKEDADNG